MSDGEQAELRTAATAYMFRKPLSPEPNAFVAGLGPAIHEKTVG